MNKDTGGMSMDTNRTCKQCGKKKKLLTSFHKDKNGRQGYASFCKDCANAKTRQRQRNTTPSNPTPKMERLKLSSSADRHQFAREQAAQNMYLD
jgi:hypothetical protein